MNDAPFVSEEQRRINKKLRENLLKWKHAYRVLSNEIATTKIDIAWFSNQSALASDADVKLVFVNSLRDSMTKLNLLRVVANAMMNTRRDLKFALIATAYKYADKPSNIAA